MSAIPQAMCDTDLPLEGVWAVPQEVDLAALLSEAASLPPLDPMELPDDEFEAFLAAIHA